MLVLRAFAVRLRVHINPEGLDKEVPEPFHGEGVHRVEHGQVLHREVEPCTMLGDRLEDLAVLLNAVLDVLCDLQLVVDILRDGLRLLQSVDEIIGLQNF